MSDRLLKLLLVDDDPIFCLGLNTALQGFVDVQVIAQVDSANRALEQWTELTGDNAPNVVVLELGIEPAGSGLQLCQRLKKESHKLPIFLLSAKADPKDLYVARTLGIEGYSPKGLATTELVALLQQVAAGEISWPYEPIPPKQLPSSPKVLINVRRSGLSQIEASLAQVQAQLLNPNLSTFDWLFWSGRERELKTARWLVSQLLPVEVVMMPPEVPPPPSALPPESPSEPSLPPSETRLRIPDLRSDLATQPSLSQSLFENTLFKIQSSLKNLTGTPLEIDILQPERKQELMYIVMQNLGKVLEESRFLNVQPEELFDRRSQMLRDIWQSSTLDFFVKYYPAAPNIREQSIIDILMENAPIIQETTLEQIPQTLELFKYLLFEESLIIDQVPYRADSPEAKARAELILDNLLLSVANSVMQLLLNYFPEVEIVKHNLYEPKYLTSRDIARFRNELSWRYRQEFYLEQPQAVFESEYRLRVLSGNGIRKVSIYAPRQLELEQLRGVQWWITVAWELRDAIAPRLRTVVSVAGSGVVYILTQVIGRGIGLIGRGIIQGIGSTLQDVRYGKHSERGK